MARGEEETIARIGREVRSAIPSSSVLEVDNDVLDALVTTLLSAPGKRMLKGLIDDLAHDSKLTLATWWPERIQPHCAQLDAAVTDQISAAMRPVLERLAAAHRSGVEGIEGPAGNVTALGLAHGVLKNLAKDYNVPVQVLEALDDIKGISGTELAAKFGDAPVDGLIAGVLGFAISCAANRKRFRDGHLRWDDAIDNVAFDTVKATGTGVLVSATIGSLAVSAPVAIGAAVVLAPLMYAVVSGVVDHVYLRLLGGAQIVTARRSHLDYLRVADVIQRDLVPRLRQLNKVGALVDALHQISIDESSRPRLRENIRSTFESITSALATSEETLRLTDEYESYALDFVGGLIERSLVRDESRRTLLSVSEMKHLTREVHIAYWREHSASSTFKRASFGTILSKVESNQLLSGESDMRLDAMREFIKLVSKSESLRPSPTDSILFETTWEGVVSGKKHAEVYRILASNHLDLALILSTMQRTKWSWDSPISLGARPTLKRVTPVKRSILDQSDRSTPNYNPRVDKVFNKHYIGGLHEDLISGKTRLFRYKNNALRSEHTSFIAAGASDDSPSEQCAELKKSLQRLHPHFRGASDLIASLRPVDDIERAVRQESDGVSELTLYGLRVYYLERYTATYRVADADPDRFGDTRHVAVEGYFHSLAEAKRAFGSISNQIQLVGVRPGPRVMNEKLRSHLKNAKENEMFMLQNQLIGRISEGLIALDQASNLSEARLASLAGAGVFLSWWWSLSGHLRQELIAALSDEQVKQAIRIELMEALLEVQRIHILSHPFFRETMFAGDARHQEDVLRAATDGIERALPSAGPA